MQVTYQITTVTNLPHPLASIQGQYQTNVSFSPQTHNEEVPDHHFSHILRTRQENQVPREVILCRQTKVLLTFQGVVRPCLL